MAGPSTRLCKAQQRFSRCPIEDRDGDGLLLLPVQMNLLAATFIMFIVSLGVKLKEGSADQPGTPVDNGTFEDAHSSMLGHSPLLPADPVGLVLSLILILISNSGHTVKR